jgi:hypothetical protein
MVGPPSRDATGYRSCHKPHRFIMSWGQSLEAVMVTNPQQNYSPNEKSSALARMIRLTWTTLGNFLLFIILILIIAGSQEVRSVLNFVYCAVVAGLILIRYIDIKVFSGHTADNEPATLKDWLTYSAGLILMAGFFWIIAQAIINKIH